MLLACPPFKGRRVETLNDADGWLVNVWRSLHSALPKLPHTVSVLSVKSTTTHAWFGCERRTPNWCHGSKATLRTTTQRLPGGGYTSPRVASVTPGAVDLGE